MDDAEAEFWLLGLGPSSVLWSRQFCAVYRPAGSSGLQASGLARTCLPVGSLLERLEPAAGVSQPLAIWKQSPAAS